MAYCTLANLKAHAGISSSDKDTVLDKCIVWAQADLDRMTGRTFECDSSSESTKYFDAYDDVDDLTLYLGEDLCAITSITNGDGTTIASSDYITLPVNVTPYERIKLLGSSSKSWEVSTDGDSENAIIVVGYWTYSAAVPSNVEYATIRLAQHYFNTRAQDTDANRVVVLESGVRLLPVGIPQDVASIVRSYQAEASYVEVV